MKNRVYIIPGGCTTWQRVDRLDQQQELKSWAKDEPREKGWLVTKGGVPSHFNKSNGDREVLRIDSTLTVLGYNILTAREDGNPKKLSMFERELEASGIYRYWENRRPNITRAIRNAHVIGLCEATHHMVNDLLVDNARMSLACHELKVGEYDGSAVLVDEARIEVVDTVQRQLVSSMVQILVACLLRDRDTDRLFWFVVLHLKSDGSGAHGGKEDVRVMQAKRVYSAIENFHPPAPVVIVGDLNSDRFLYPSFDEQGQSHVLDVFHDYKCVLPLQPTYHHWNRAAFDHILLRNADAVKTHVPASGGVCPNDKQGSDHLPVKADIVIHPID